jgi:hypothetical protein
MGRYDALTQLEEKPEKKDPSPVVSSPTAKKLPTQPIENQGDDGKKPAKPLTRKTASQSLTLPEIEKPEKYTTRLEPSLIKKIRLDAIEKDIKDYEVVKEALNLYFNKRQ